MIVALESFQNVLLAFAFFAAIVGLLVYFSWNKLTRFCFWISEEKNPVFQVTIIVLRNYDNLL
jgi:hypothetical protein